MNGNHEIALGFSVSSPEEYPGIRYVGQSAEENEIGDGYMDYQEEIIHTGTVGQKRATRWGDYWNMAIDPDNDHTFWNLVGHSTPVHSKAAHTGRSRIYRNSLGIVECFVRPGRIVGDFDSTDVRFLQIHDGTQNQRFF